jgi:biotin carboxyl carrier protein
VSDEAATDRVEHSDEDAAARMDVLTREVLPALVARLGSSHLGELEVRADGWRVRLRRAPLRSRVSADGVSGSSRGATDDDGPIEARSPGVGYFIPGPKLQVGQAVGQGDRLGAVDVLGIEQEVTAPRDGIIGRIYVEPGQAVEYGQELAAINAEGALLDALDEGPVAD